MKLSHNKRPLFIAVTGNVASGKSTVVEYIKSKGYEVISVDDLNRQLLEEKDTIDELVNIFGNGIILKNKIDKIKLRELVFNNPEDLKKLNYLMHGKLIYRLVEIMSGNIHPAQLFKGGDAKAPICKGGDAKAPLCKGGRGVDHVNFFEVPLLFECGIQDAFDYVVLVVSNKNLMIQRCMKRDNCSKQEAISILNNQMNPELKIDKSHIVLENNSSKEDLLRQVNVFLQSVKYLKKRKIKPLLEVYNGN